MGVAMCRLLEPIHTRNDFVMIGGAQHPLPIFPAVFSAVNAGSYQTVLTRSS